MNKHTPGPWIIKRVAHSTRDSVRIIDQQTHGVLCEVRDAYYNTQGYANAALIAAAPELAEALRELAKIGEGGVIQINETGKPTWSALEAVASIARAALAKAGVEC